MSALRACRFGDRWEIVRDVDGIGRRIGILHDKADADRFVASDDLLAACKEMSACAGPCENWRGETFTALLHIEEAIALAEFDGGATAAPREG
ncbi:MAG: hypothetical protein Q8P41_31705 [Pseudomonadota bacterium]|nr:hypothetical protein [Pseudomonadota bacterium]